jgi:hypothetical protein
MRIVDRLSTIERSIVLLRGLVILLAFGILSLGRLQAQAAPSKGIANSSSPDGGFSIESEMLTYRALQSNSEAIACDIAAYLNGATASFVNPPVGSVCDVRAGTTNAGVVLLPFDTNEFADFQIWRADMATMDRLQRRAEVDCPTEPVTVRRDSTKSATSAASAASDVVSMSPAGPAVNLAQSVLAMMASEESISQVGGTVQDQAFMDGVSRELHALSVTVLMPAAYTPYSFAVLDESNSPFLASLARTIAARGCLADLVTKDDTKYKPRIQRTIAEMDAFLGVITKGAESTTKSTTAQTTQQTGEGPVAPTSPRTGSSDVPPAAPTSPSHLKAVLMADGLAIKLGVNPATGALADNGASQHVLLLKALESGGSVVKHSNILGTRIRYSGGAVGTYALFTIDGDLECSGNVYEYGGSIKAKEFKKSLQNYNPNPAKQMVFLRRSCRPQSQARSFVVTGPEDHKHKSLWGRQKR